MINNLITDIEKCTYNNSTGMCKIKIAVMFYKLLSSSPLILTVFIHTSPVYVNEPVMNVGMIFILRMVHR